MTEYYTVKISDQNSPKNYFLIHSFIQGKIDKLLPFKIINFVHPLYFFSSDFHLLCSKLESVKHCLWKKQLHNIIHFSRNLEIVCCTAWHSSSKISLCLYVKLRKIHIHLIKSKYPVDIRVFGVVTSDGDVMPLFIFSHSLTLNMEACIKCLEELVLPWIEKVVAARHYIKQPDSTLCQTCRRIEFWLWENFCDYITLTSECLMPQIAIPLIMCGVQLSKTSVQHQRWTEGNDNSSIYQFKQGNHWKGLQEILIWRLCNFVKYIW